MSHHSSLLTLPNLLSVFRILLGFVLLLSADLLQSSYSFWKWCFLISIVVIAEMTDFLDGFFARRYQLISNVGKLLDPLADVVFHSALFLLFTKPPFSLSILAVYLLLLREFLVLGIRLFGALQDRVLSASFAGKIKTALFALGSLLLLSLAASISLGYGPSEASMLRYTINFGRVWIAASYLSALSYFRFFYQLLK